MIHVQKYKCIIKYQRIGTDINGYIFISRSFLVINNFRFYKCCIYHFSYTITNQQAAGKYQLDMSMKICFETTGACYFEMSIFSGTQLPKKYCITGSAFYDSGNNNFIFNVTFLSCLWR